MIGILAVLLLSIAGFYLGYKLYKSNKEDNETVSMYAAITMICAVTGGIVLTSYLLLNDFFKNNVGIIDIKLALPHLSPRPLIVP